MHEWNTSSILNRSVRNVSFTRPEARVQYPRIVHGWNLDLDSSSCKVSLTCTIACMVIILLA